MAEWSEPWENRVLRPRFESWKRKLWEQWRLICAKPVMAGSHHQRLMYRTTIRASELSSPFFFLLYIFWFFLSLDPPISNQTREFCLPWLSLLHSIIQISNLPPGLTEKKNKNNNNSVFGGRRAVGRKWKGSE